MGKKFFRDVERCAFVISPSRRMNEEKRVEGGIEV